MIKFWEWLKKTRKIFTEIQKQKVVFVKKLNKKKATSEIPEIALFVMEN